jgi:hypothetical protein
VSLVKLVFFFFNLIFLFLFLFLSSLFFFYLFLFIHTPQGTESAEHLSSTPSKHSLPVLCKTTKGVNNISSMSETALAANSPSTLIEHNKTHLTRVYPMVIPFPLIHYTSSFIHSFIHHSNSHQGNTSRQHQL